MTMRPSPIPSNPIRWIIALIVSLTAQVAVADTTCAPDRITFDTAAGPVTYSVELAITPAEKERGLMFRRQMPADHGMLFIYDPPVEAAFWMKNTFLPLDMIFIDDRGKVVRVAANTVPFSLAIHKAGTEVRAVLEVNAGRSAQHGISTGTQAHHPDFSQAPEGVRCGN